MPRTNIPVNITDRAGLDPSGLEVTADATNDHSMANDGNTLLLIRNSNAGAPSTATFVIPGTVDGQTVANKTLTVSAGVTQSRIVGPFPTNTYGGTLNIDVADTNLRFVAFRATS